MNMRRATSEPVPRNPLEVLGLKHQPSKRMHDYLKHYWLHFRDIQESARVVLEIGVQSGRSVRMWQEFFVNATVHGVDTDPDCMRQEDERIRIHIGDQADAGFLANLCDEIGKPDIIIDDGSHIADHQIRSFEILFPHLVEHGIYVIEDIGVHPGRSRMRTCERVKSLLDNINYWPPGFPGEKWPELDSFPEGASAYDRHVVGVAVYRYLAFILKGRNPEDNPFLAIPVASASSASGG